MRVLLGILFIIALAVGLSLAAQHNAGYVMFIRAPYRIELSLNLFVVLLVAAFAALYVLVRLVVHTLRVPDYVKNMQSKRKRKHAQTNLVEAIQAFFEGDYVNAEKKALQASELREAADLAAVIAARSAHGLKAYDRRDVYLMPSGEQAFGHAAIKTLIQAELLLEREEFELALQALTTLQKTGYVTPKTLQLEFAAQQGMKNWDAAMALLPQLEKHGVLDAEQSQALRIKSHQENLRRRVFDPQALRAYWSSMLEMDKLDRSLALSAARYFSTLGDCMGAHDIIARSLDSQWDRELIALYAECHSADLVKQIENAERWLNRHSRDAVLLLTLGELCGRQKLWGKAQSYLEASLSVEASSDGHHALAQLLEKLDKPEDAARHYKRSLELARSITH